MIVFERVSVTYADATEPVLSGVDLHLPEGELCLVVGRTGSGKSTLLGCVNGLVPHFTGGRLSGRVLVDGRDTREHRPRDLADVVGVVGQNPAGSFVADTVEDELAYGVVAVAVPVLDPQGRVVAALNSSSHSRRITKVKLVRERLAMLRQASRQISTELARVPGLALSAQV